MKKIKLYSLLIITPLFILLNRTIFADMPQDFYPHFQVSIDNKLTEAVIATFYPSHYSPDVWNGACSERVFPSYPKTLCKDVQELYQGIPAYFTTYDTALLPSDPFFPPASNCGGGKFFDMPDGRVVFCNINEDKVFANLLKPFAGDIVISNATNGKELAKLHYVLQIHQATRWTKLRRMNTEILPADEGRYMQWDPITYESYDPKVSVDIKENYPTGYNWCWLTDDSSSQQREQGTTPCTSRPVITLSVAPPEKPISTTGPYY